MKSIVEYFHCGNQLRNAMQGEIREIETIITSVQWAEDFNIVVDQKVFAYQTGYNKAFEFHFVEYGWNKQPILRTEPKLIGDFQKKLVFVEVQFGNSSSLYRDYYKFQYGLMHGLLSLAVLIVPYSPEKFFPTRKLSVNNMAEYSLAYSCFSILPINVPVLLIGLLPEN